MMSNLGNSSGAAGWDSKGDTIEDEQEKEDCWLHEYVGKSWEGTRQFWQKRKEPDGAEITGNTTSECTRTVIAMQELIAWEYTEFMFGKT